MSDVCETIANVVISHLKPNTDGEIEYRRLDVYPYFYVTNVDGHSIVVICHAYTKSSTVSISSSGYVIYSPHTMEVPRAQRPTAAYYYSNPNFMELLIEDMRSTIPEVMNAS